LALSEDWRVNGTSHVWFFAAILARFVYVLELLLVDSDWLLLFNLAGDHLRSRKVVNAHRYFVLRKVVSNRQLTHWLGELSLGWLISELLRLTEVFPVLVFVFVVSLLIASLLL